MRKIRKRLLTQLIRSLSKAGRVNLYDITQRRLGILQYESNQVSGEHYFINKVLPALLKGTVSPVMFDVGLNEGTYTKQLNKVFPEAYFYGFEPVAATLKRAQENLVEINSKTSLFLK